jgi:hypothetical protein
MMTRAQRREAALRQRWLAILQAELLRREEEDGGDRREQVLGELIAKLDQMAERRKHAAWAAGSSVWVG